MRRISIVVAGVLLIITASLVFAHPGGTDGNGCHVCRTNCNGWGIPFGFYHRHYPVRACFQRAAPVPTPTPIPFRPGTYRSCEAVPNSHLRLDTQGRVAVRRNLVPTQPDSDNDGFACGGQLEHKRPTLTPTPTPHPTPTPTKTVTARPHRIGNGVRYTPTNEVYGACRARFPYTHIDDCNVDYDWLMMFWLRSLS